MGRHCNTLRCRKASALLYESKLCSHAGARAEGLAASIPEGCSMRRSIRCDAAPRRLRGLELGCALRMCRAVRWDAAGGPHLRGLELGDLAGELLHVLARLVVLRPQPLPVAPLRRAVLLAQHTHVPSCMHHSVAVRQGLRHAGPECVPPQCA